MVRSIRQFVDSLYFCCSMLIPTNCLDAMYDFARAQEVWYKTWPEDPKRRGMAM